MLEPALIVADEPTSRLDPILQRETIRVLRQALRMRSIGMVLISHNTTLLDRVADGMVVLGGQLGS